MHVSKRLQFSIIISILMLLLVGTIPAFAQDLAVRWSAYLFTSQTGDLVRVFQDGAQATYNLGLEANTYVGGSDLAFTADGQRVAFCVFKPSDTGGQGTATLFMRDIEKSTNTMQLDLGKTIGCRTGDHAFSADGTQLTIARVNYYPGDPAADTSAPSWQLTVVDAATGTTVQEVNAQTPAAENAGIAADAPMLPYIQYFANNQVIFAAVPYGIGGGGEFPAYIWQTDSGTVAPIERWGNLGLDTLDSTGELIWVTADPNRAAAQPGGPMPPNNELKLADKTGEDRVIYYTPDWVLTDAKFINGEQQIAIQETSSFDQNNPDQPQVTKWVALDRAGNVSDLQNVTFYGNLVAAPQGYAILDTQFLGANQTQPKYTFDWHSNGTITTLWSLETADMSSSWELAWSAFTQPAENLQAFPTFTG